MKKLILIFAIAFGMLSLSATNPTASEKTAKETTKISAENVSSCGGVTGSMVADYLRNCSHHHTVYSEAPIPGTCNWLAQIESCGTSVVYVDNGIIIGHADSGIGTCSKPGSKVIVTAAK